jgi:hypothetical protein
MIANHFVVPDGLQTYADVVRYLSNPLWVLELTFLVMVTGHAALGVRATCPTWACRGTVGLSASRSVPWPSPWLTAPGSSPQTSGQA